MKFARYLQDTQTPEWKNAYIDYRGLKVQLGVIRTQALQQVDTSSYFGKTSADHIHHSAPNIEVEDESDGESTVEHHFCP
ncbi:hypothetical protein OG21DRAFT_1504341 [Imleria badia]|nr:hypothetical protein OG21DRAFT_1504341 [Imleria badia]